MYLLLSGEGPSDIGSCSVDTGGICDSQHFQPGPMAWFVDQWAEEFQGFGFSHINFGRVGFVSEKALSGHCKKNSGGRKIPLTGKRRNQETGYFFQNARGLGEFAQKLAEEQQESVVAVLFRDSDGTASAGRGIRRQKVESVQNGFQAVGFHHGVPMIPNPKSEAWLLCAVKPRSPYQHCGVLEAMSGNDKAPNPLKDQLEAALGEYPSAERLSEMVRGKQIDVSRIEMPSLQEFKDSLSLAVQVAVARQN